MLNGLPVARIEVLLLPVASLVRLPDPTPSLQPHYELSSLLRVGPPQCSASVRWPRGFRRLGFSLSIRATGSCSSAPQPRVVKNLKRFEKAWFCTAAVPLRRTARLQWLKCSAPASGQTSCSSSRSGEGTRTLPRL